MTVNQKYNRILVEKLKDAFRDVFGRECEGIFFAPGRVNLIGEHTDYNGGHVFPCALSMGTYGAIAKRADDEFRFYSLNLPEQGILSVAMETLAPGRTDAWSTYPEGVIWAIQSTGHDLPHGADLMFAGDVPAGSGLSSSASMEVLTGLMVRDLYGLEELSLPEIARIGQMGENQYCGMQCGIMDQFASAMGRRNQAIYLNTDSLDYEYAPLELGNQMLLLTNSGVKHSLVSSAYNDRRRECQAALEALQRVPVLQGIRALCEISEEDFETYSHAISDPVLRDRAEHAVREEARTKRAVNALRAGDIPAFGRLMNESHDSLRRKYRVSCEELDFLTDMAQAMPGVLGSRMTGGGFGGCTISIVDIDGAKEFMERIQEAYGQRFAITPAFHAVIPGEGAHRLDG